MLSTENRLFTVLRLLNELCHERDSKHTDQRVEAEEKAVSADVVEIVHQLRVATRRATAVLSLYDNWLPAKRSEKMTKILKRIRQAAGATRDLDVMLLRYNSLPQQHEAQDRQSAGPPVNQSDDPDGNSASTSSRRHPHLITQLRENRATAFQLLFRTCSHFAEGQRYKRKARRLMVSVGYRENEARDLSFQVWAPRRLHEYAQTFFLAVPTDTHDTQLLHQFRVRGKQLRYVIEALSSAFPQSIREQLYPAVETLQEKLGQINDYSVAIGILQHMLDEAPGRSLREEAGEVLELEKRQLQEQLMRFREWWVPAFIDGLRTMTAGFLLS